MELLPFWGEMLCYELGRFKSHDNGRHGKLRSPQNSKFKLFKDGGMRLPRTFCHTEKKMLLSPCILRGMEMDKAVQCILGMRSVSSDNAILRKFLAKKFYKQG